MYGFRLVSDPRPKQSSGDWEMPKWTALLAVLVCFCVEFCWSKLVSLRLCVSVWFWFGFSWFRCVCVFHVVLGWSRTVSLRLFGSVWFWAGLGWSRCVCVVLFGSVCSRLVSRCASSFEFFSLPPPPNLQSNFSWVYRGYIYIYIYIFLRDPRMQQVRSIRVANYTVVLCFQHTAKTRTCARVCVYACMSALHAIKTARVIK